MVRGLPARHHYRSLRVIARLHVVVHALIVVMGAGGVIVGTAVAARRGLGLAIGILFGGGAAVTLALLYSLAEAAIILLALELEERTRLTARAVARRSHPPQEVPLGTHGASAPRS